VSDPLETRLRDSLSRHAADATPSADGWLAIRERAEREGGILRRRRRTFRLAASGALAALVAVAVPLALDRVRSDDDIAFAPPPPITAETVTPSPSATATEPAPGEPTVAASASPAPSTAPVPAPTEEQVWTVVDDGGALTPGPSASIEDAVSMESTVVAVGSFFPTDDARQAAVWTSRDGGDPGLRDWRLLDDAALFGGQPGTYTSALGVALTNHGLVAVGTTYAGEEADLALAWTSRDGETWQRTALPGDGRAVAVTEITELTPGDRWTPGDLVAVGSAIGSVPAVWTSTDGGATWEITVLDLLGDEGQLDHVVSIGARVVAMGRSSVAISQDGGGSWTQITHEEAGLPQNVEDVVVFGDGSLAAVVWTDSGLVAYTSADGSAWVPGAPFPSSPQDSNQRVGEILGLPDGRLVAGGLAFEMGAGEVAAVWTSTDAGLTWVRDADATAALREGSSVEGLAATESNLIALGSGPGFAGGRAWTHPHYPSMYGPRGAAE